MYIDYGLVTDSDSRVGVCVKAESAETLFCCHIVKWLVTSGFVFVAWSTGETMSEATASRGVHFFIGNDRGGGVHMPLLW